MLSIPQAAERLGISRQATLKLIQRGTLKATQVGRAWVIEEEEVRKRLKAKE